MAQLAVSTVTSAVTNVPDGVRVSIEVDCGTKTVLSGGYAEVDSSGADSTSNTGLDVVTSRPDTTGHKWQVVARTGGSAGSYIRVYAVCVG